MNQVMSQFSLAVFILKKQSRTIFQHIRKPFKARVDNLFSILHKLSFSLELFAMLDLQN